MPTFTELNNAIVNLWNVLYTRWLSEELFSFNWFLIVGTIIIMYAVFIKLIDKSRVREILLYGSFLAVSFGYIDVVGTTIGLWVYNTHLLPLNPSLFPFTYTLHPIIHVLAYQYSHSWRSFSIINTLATALLSFVGQPIYVGLQIVVLNNWNYFYTFIVSMVVTFLARAVVIWLANIEQKHSTEPSRANLVPKLQPAMKLMDQDDENEQ
jgi:hypothetical protein